MASNTRRVARLALLAFTAWALWAGWLVGSAWLQLRDGRHTVRELGALSPAQIIDRGPTDVASARRRFATASDRLGSPWLAPVRLAPVLGRQVRATRSLSTSAARVAAVTAKALADGRELIRRPRPSGETRVALLGSAAGLVTSLRDELDEVDAGRYRNLLSPVAAARAEFAAELERFRRAATDAAAATQGLEAFLRGPTRYLLFAANNAEMRAGSGMFLSVGELRITAGRIEITAMQPVYDVEVPSGRVQPEGDLGARWGWLEPHLEWRNLMASPRFDRSAELASRMWEAAGRGTVDGVMAIDPVGLQAVLRATGGVTIDEVEYNEETVVDELLHSQYLRYPDESARRDRLQDIAVAAFSGLEQRDWSPLRLLEGLTDAARGRHVLAWSPRAGDQAAWVALGVDGTLTPASVAVSVLNRGVNKLDPFMTVRVDVHSKRMARRWDVELRISLRNDAPPEDPPYVVGPPPGFPAEPGEYVGILAVTLPGSAADARIDGVEKLVAAGPDGQTRVVATEFRIRRGSSGRFVVRWSLPREVAGFRIEPSARVPQVEWRYGRERWRDHKRETLLFRR